MRKRVLIVDDEPNILIALEFLLQHEGYEVLSASDGEAGLALVQTARPDLLVLDVMMPKRDGYAVLSAIRGDPELAATRVLMLTAKGRAAERDRGLARGADGYMGKPFATNDLLETVKRLLADPD